MTAATRVPSSETWGSVRRNGRIDDHLLRPHLGGDVLPSSDTTSAIYFCSGKSWKCVDHRVRPPGSRIVRRRLYRYRYLLLGMSAVVMFALIGSGYITRTSSIDLSSGGLADWSYYGRDQQGTRYAPVDQINRNNVSYLETAWEYHTGDFSDGSDGRPETTFQATPILVDQVLYFATVYGRVIALNAETGAEIWKYDPEIDVTVKRGEFANRGVTYWHAADDVQGRPCERRIFLATVDARLIALDAARGLPCADFGQNGQVDLSRGVDLGEYAVDSREYGVTSPPVIVGNLVVVGSAIGDNRAATLERGIVRAFHARTGELRWLWDPVPRDPTDAAFQTWADDSARRTGAANVWAQMSVDVARDLVFVPTSSPSPDYYGGKRPGSNYYADSVVALRGSTGELVWHFQIVHHNIWDYDLPAQPDLITVRKDGREIPAVAQPTKMGFLFLLNRETGEPIFPVEERPVPRSDVPGEKSWPTQPFPTIPRPLAPTTLSSDDAWGLTPWDQGQCRKLIERYRNQGIFTPSSAEGTIQYPGVIGGTNWGSAAFEPERGWVILNMSRLPSVTGLIPREKLESGKHDVPDGAAISQMRGTPYGLFRIPALLSPLELPCTKPPWGVLLAVDTATGDVKWDVPLGTVQDLAPVPLPVKWGTPNLGGPIVTEGGLIFIGAAMDNFLRAFDVETGKELWKGRLPAGGQATPMTYRATENGRQFVVIAAGGHGRLGTDIGDSVVAFALPDSGGRLLAQTAARILWTVGVLFVLFLGFLFVYKFTRKNWFWYPLLAILTMIATWATWLVSQTKPVTVLVMFVALAIAWLLTLGRKRLRAR
jgi:quinoprotein glucose dehydrogenase